MSNEALRRKGARYVPALYDSPSLLPDLWRTVVPAAPANLILTSGTGRNPRRGRTDVVSTALPAMVPLTFTPSATSSSPWILNSRSPISVGVLPTHTPLWRAMSTRTRTDNTTTHRSFGRVDRKPAVVTPDSDVGARAALLSPTGQKAADSAIATSSLTTSSSAKTKRTPAWLISGSR